MIVEKLGSIGLIACVVGVVSCTGHHGADDGAPVERSPAVTHAEARAVLAGRKIGRLTVARAEAPSSLLTAKLPASGEASAHVYLEGVDATIDVAPVGTLRRSVTPHADGALTVFTDVVEDADRVVANGADTFEELWILHSAKAPTSYRVHVEASGSIEHVRLREGRIELVDATGYVRLSSESFVAEDAKGTRRTLTLNALARKDEKSLDVVASLDVTGLVYPIVIDPAWVPTESMSNERSAAGVTAIAGNKVLVVGGGPSGAELFDPATGTWSSAGTPVNSYGGDGIQTDAPMHAVLLADGTVLVVDGEFAASDRYTPSTGAWKTTSPLPATGFIGVAAYPAGSGYAAGALAACKGATTSASLFNLASNGWAATTPMNVARTKCAAVTLANGRVLVAGGGSATAEVFNPATKTWTNTGAMLAARDYPTATLLPNGNVLVAGGSGLASAEIYNPNTNAWTSAGSMATARSFAGAALTTAGKVLVAGGSTGSVGLQAADMYDPATNSWTALPSMVSQRKWPMVAALPAGQVLAAGGIQSDAGATTILIFASAEIYGRLIGQPCKATTDCATGYCVDGVCCGAASCPSGAFCNNPQKPGVCSKPIGTLCASNAECANGLCVDGVCCQTTCTGQCQACDVAGSLGTCFPVTGPPHGTRAACNNTGADPSCVSVCNGSDVNACHFPGATQACGSATCKGGIETHVAKCTDTGACGDTPRNCGAYACGASACNTACSAPTDCASGFTCQGGACKPTSGLGGACASAADCSTGFCTDGVCCGVALCDVGSSCGTPQMAGTCAKVNGTACASAAECASGNCVDGVCCDTACTDQCQACDVTGKFGTCWPVLGDVHPNGGARTACSDGANDICAARQCDGTNTGTCAAFVNGSSTQCSEPSCAVDVFTGPGTCDQTGTCATPTAQRCAPYRCDKGGCRTACTKNTDCDDGYACANQACVAIVATCSKDGTQSTAKDGTVTQCSPFVCGSTGVCITACVTSEDCASGFVCDTTSKTCSASGGGGTGSSGGCAVGDGDSNGGALWGVGLAGLLAIGLLRRRR